MAELWVTISPASLRNLVRMFPGVCGPSLSASRVSLSAVSVPLYACSWYTPRPVLSHTTAIPIQGNSEYVVVRAELEVVPIPDGWSFEEAAQLGVAPLTALQCLHETLELPLPFEGSHRRAASTHHSHLGRRVGCRSICHPIRKVMRTPRPDDGFFQKFRPCRGSARTRCSITATRVSWRRFAQRLVMRLTLPLIRSRRARRLRKSLA
jgi:hypothetical protein